jgi:hypothetical protein
MNHLNLLGSSLLVKIVEWKYGVNNKAGGGIKF